MKTAFKSTAMLSLVCLCGCFPPPGQNTEAQSAPTVKTSDEKTDMTVETTVAETVQPKPGELVVNFGFDDGRVVIVGDRDRVQLVTYVLMHIEKGRPIEDVVKDAVAEMEAAR